MIQTNYWINVWFLLLTLHDKKEKEKRYQLISYNNIQSLEPPLNN